MSVNVAGRRRQQTLAEELTAWLMEFEDRVDQMMRENIVATMEHGVALKRWIRSQRAQIPILLNGESAK